MAATYYYCNGGGGLKKTPAGSAGADKININMLNRILVGGGGGVKLRNYPHMASAGGPENFRRKGQWLLNF